MLKRIISLILVMIMMVSFTACRKKKIDDQSGEIIPHDYEEKQFEISGLWAPRELSEESIMQYRDAGFNVFSFSNHDELPRSSENQYYLGSKRTMEALKLCKKVGMDVYIAYGDSWFNRANEGDEYFEGTPFSRHNYYGEYMDMIKGVRIKDEPDKKTMEYLANDTLIEDFKKVYAGKKYMINLIPETSITTRGYDSYPEMLEHLGQDILSKFENPYISVDCYLYSHLAAVGGNIINNYNQIANTAKKYGAETNFILQSSTGNEFLDTLSEADMRQQAYLAIAFGADDLQYYCYSVPDEIPYNYCMLEKDNKTPSELYYHVKTVNAEIQKFASAVLAYDWDQAMGVSGSEDTTFRVCSIEEVLNPETGEYEVVVLKNAKHFVSAEASQDLVISRFTSEKYGEAYMFVNFAENNEKLNVVNATFKDCRAVVIYGGEGYSGTPEIVELGDDGNLTLELTYGEGVFITPFAK